jgi:glutamate-1-semialdehyde 2,1-aminomutase
MGHGALILGHAHPAVVEAVRRQVGEGTHFGAGHALEVTWAEQIISLVDSVELVRFTSSGTEATMLALRLARAFTGRDLLAKVDGHFHGWHDAVSVDLGPDRSPQSPPGVPTVVRDLTRVIDPADPDGLERALGDSRVAALILEPSGAHFGHTPLPDGYVARARELCDRTGTLLIVDEVITGFRVDTGGMQRVLNVTPDLTTFGKIVAGGLPGGAVGGRAEIMEQLAVHGGHAVVTHPGTFNANPLSAAAGTTTLALIAGGAPLRAAERSAVELERIWNERLRTIGVSGRVWRLASMVHVELGDPVAQEALSGELRDAGADFFRTSAFLSTAHGDAELEDTQTAIDRALRRAAVVAG